MSTRASREGRARPRWIGRALARRRSVWRSRSSRCAGARVYADGADRGPTPATVLGPCGKAVDIIIRADGFEQDRENIVLKQRSGRYVKTLKRIPTGRLELVLNFNASLYVDNRLIGEA